MDELRAYADRCLGLGDMIPDQGCTVCKQMGQALTSHLFTGQFRLATREDEQERHTLGRGFCPLHTWQYAAVASAAAVEHQPPAGHCCGNTVCRAAARSSSAAAVDGELHSQNDHDRSAQGGRPPGQSAGQPTTLARVQDGGGVPGADADDVAAVAAYRLSLQADNPLSGRKLAQMFGRTSRRWARARIADAR